MFTLLINSDEFFTAELGYAISLSLTTLLDYMYLGDVDKLKLFSFRLSQSKINYLNMFII